MNDPLPPFLDARPVGLALRAAALPLCKGENTALEFAELIVPLEKGNGRGAAGGRSHTMSYPFFVQSFSNGGNAERKYEPHTA